MDNYLRITKPIKLIETFSGYGSQIQALKNIGANVSSHCISEWEINVNNSYWISHNKNNTIDYSKDFSKEELIDILFNMGVSFDGKTPSTKEKLSKKNEKWIRETFNHFKANNNLGSICNIKGEDLNITDKEHYTYMLTYSYPCTSLSLSGKRLGMEKNSGTASSLLWEIQRILDELNNINHNNLPDILLMENVTQVHSKSLNKNTGRSNLDAFNEWLNYLDDLGYNTIYFDLNSKDFNIPQSRNRCYAVSYLKSSFPNIESYKIPEKLGLNKRLKDILEDNVDEKYYINSDRARELIEKLIKENKLFLKDTNDINTLGNYMASGYDASRVVDINGIAPTVKENHGTVTGIVSIKQIGGLSSNSSQRNRIYDKNGLAPTIQSANGTGGGNIPLIIHSQIVAMRGRNPDNPTSRISGLNTEQRLEPNNKEYSNTITTAVKDNLLLESNIIRVGNISSEHSQCGSVIDSNGIMNTLGAGCHGYANSHILTYEDINEKNKDWIFKVNGIDYCIRIRKLTETECGRLMGVKDNMIQDMSSLNSKSALYKQFGNSIVINVLESIFTNMLI